MIAFITLYIVNFLRTIFVIAIIYFGIRLITRFILPFLVDKGIKNMQQKMQDQQKRNQARRPEGEVTIESKPTSKHNHSDNKGEYIDFEEVD